MNFFNLDLPCACHDFGFFFNFLIKDTVAADTTLMNVSLFNFDADECFWRRAVRCRLEEDLRHIKTDFQAQQFRDKEEADYHLL